MSLLDRVTSAVWACEPLHLEKVAGLAARHDALPPGMGVTLPADVLAGLAAARDGEISRLSAASFGPEFMASLGLHAAGGSGGPSQARRNADGRPAYSNFGGVGVVPVVGMVAKFASMVNGPSQPQGTSVGAILDGVRSAVADPEVNSVLLYVYSPGGMVDGVADLADEIAKIAKSSGKAVWAFVDGLGASAAYWIASSASRVVATRDSLTPSIGVYIVVQDSSAKAEREGVKVHVVRSTELKGAGVPGSPVTEAALAKWAEIVNATHATFVAAVGRGRGARMTAEQLAAAADGTVMPADKAMGLGLIDQIGTLESVLSDMRTRFPGSSGGVGGRTIAADAAGVGSMSAGSGSGLGADVKIDGNNTGTGVVQGNDAATKAAEDRGAQRAREAIAARVTELQLMRGAFADKPECLKIIDGAITNAATDTRSVDDVRREVFASAAKAAPAVRQSEPVVADGGLGGYGGVNVSIGADGREKKLQAHTLAQICRGNPMLLRQIAEAAGSADPHTRLKADEAAGHLGYANAAEAVKAGREIQSAGLMGFSLIQTARVLDAGFIATRFGAARMVNDHQLADELMRSLDAPGVLANNFGHSSGDFPTLLKNTTNKMLLARYALAATTWQRWCATDNFSDFKSRDFITLSDLGPDEVVPPGGTVKEQTLSESAENAKLATFGLGVSVSREMLINDDLGGITRQVNRIADIFAVRPERLAVAALAANMADGQPVFRTQRNNLSTTSPLNYANMALRIQDFMLKNQPGSTNNPANLMPQVLLVSPTLATTARQVTQNPTDPTSGTANSGIENVWRNTLQPVIAPWLGVTTDWFLFADPASTPGIVVGFLNGNQRPIIGDITGGSVRGVRYEYLFDCVAKAIDPLPMHKCTA